MILGIFQKDIFFSIIATRKVRFIKPDETRFKLVQ